VYLIRLAQPAHLNPFTDVVPRGSQTVHYIYPPGLPRGIGFKINAAKEDLKYD